ncbi:hypothetical protein PanWU01x14_244710 [Parasponia andersonii]|uniref:Uncharacterized protein n=1 Tax=Parasponia andersonii TaxID=3476 RepID=A0A2P5BF21_PARAD|nr:hypothetical protein PanWU01x14_244710 [Parasponia andersonii]
MKEPALAVQKRTLGMPSSSDTSRVNDMRASENMQVTGGKTTSSYEAASLSFWTRWRKGARQFLAVESQREGTSWVASASEGGRPSGIVSKRKEGKPCKELWPRDLRRRLWLNSVLTKVM